MIAEPSNCQGERMPAGYLRASCSRSKGPIITTSPLILGADFSVSLLRRSGRLEAYQRIHAQCKLFAKLYEMLHSAVVVG